MTQQNIDQAPEVAQSSLPPCLAEALPPLIAAHEAEIAGFEHAKGEMFEIDERIAEAGKWIEAAVSVADEASSKCLSILKTKGCTPKDVLKEKAKQLSAAMDIETYKSVISDLDIHNKQWELKAHEKSNAVRSSRDAIRNAAIARLKEALPDVLPPELFMLVQLLVELASSGDSTAFNTHPFIKTPLEFALKEVSVIIAGAVPGDRRDLGMAKILPPLPSGMAEFGKSPIQMQRLLDELARQEVAQ